VHQNNVYNNWKGSQNNLTLFHLLVVVLTVVLVLLLVFVFTGLVFPFFLQLQAMVLNFKSYVIFYIDKYMIKVK